MIRALWIAAGIMACAALVVRFIPPRVPPAASASSSSDLSAITPEVVAAERALVSPANLPAAPRLPPADPAQVAQLYSVALGPWAQREFVLPDRSDTTLRLPQRWPGTGAFVVVLTIHDSTRVAQPLVQELTGRFWLPADPASPQITLGQLRLGGTSFTSQAITFAIDQGIVRALDAPALDAKQTSIATESARLLLGICGDPGGRTIAFGDRLPIAGQPYRFVCVEGEHHLFLPDAWWTGEDAEHRKPPRAIAGTDDRLDLCLISAPAGRINALERVVAGKASQTSGGFSFRVARAVCVFDEEGPAAVSATSAAPLLP